MGVHRLLVFCHLSHDMLSSRFRPLLQAYKSRYKACMPLQVKEVADGRCTVQYKGPPTIGSGIVAAVKSQFPDIVDVVMTD